MTETTTDPNAPTEHKLPSGLTVTLRSYRTLKRPDMHAVWACGGSAPAEHDALMGMLVTASSDPAFATPFGTDVLDRLDGADYIALYRLVNDAWRMVNGLDVLPDPDDYQDPKAPTTASSGSAPDSEVTIPLTSAANGTTSPTTSTSTAPADGRPVS
jgi:hypothetical protein